MSGHNKWTQIKHQKGIVDQKRSQLFSKLLQSITIAARADSDPKFNPTLRSAVEKAKENNVPLENIERAIKRASGEGVVLEETILEAYDESGAALLILSVTDNRNRTIARVKKILSDHNGKLAEAGSVQWAFEIKNGSAQREAHEGFWAPKFPHYVKPEKMARLRLLIKDLEGNEDVRGVFTNAVE